LLSGLALNCLASISATSSSSFSLLLLTCTICVCMYVCMYVSEYVYMYIHTRYACVRVYQSMYAPLVSRPNNKVTRSNAHIQSPFPS
jgi:hypothetical protein